jgi:hypothetical protein
VTYFARAGDNEPHVSERTIFVLIALALYDACAKVRRYFQRMLDALFRFLDFPAGSLRQQELGAHVA